MPIDATMLDADITAVETNEAGIGTVVEITLPDGISVVNGIRRGRSDDLAMAFTGYAEGGGDEFAVRRSQFVALGVPEPLAKQVLSVKEGEQEQKPWLIESADKPDSALITFKVKPNW